MKITNENKIPEPIFRAISSNWYGGSNFNHFCSVTALLKGAKQFVLEKRHYDEIELEASDQVWSLMGSAMHKVLEVAETKDNLVEERLSAVINGKILSGGIDHYEDGKISDFKFTSVWSWIFGSRIKEWEIQLNAYAYLFRKAGFKVEKLEIICIFRDWQKSKFKYKKKTERYPNQIETINLRIWKDEEIEKLIFNKIQEFEKAMELPDDMISPCTLEERWEDNPQFAVIRKGASRATKLCSTEEEAEKYRAGLGEPEEYRIEERIKEPKKCSDYCSVNKFCSFYKSRFIDANIPESIAA